MRVDFSQYLRDDGTIDLVRYFRKHDKPAGATASGILKAINYLREVERIWPTSSRQVAAVALAHAFTLAVEK